MKFLRILAIGLLLFNGLGALYGGGSLLFDPSGKFLGLPLAYLSSSPFRDYFWPGLILFVFNGLSSLIICLAVLLKLKTAPLLTILQAMILCGWLLIQVAMLHIFNGLHVVMGITGLLLIGVGGIGRMKELKNKELKNE